MNFLIVLAILITILSLTLITTLLVVIFGLNMIYTNIKTKTPYTRIPLANLKKILEEINLPTGSAVCDLGCGDGRFLFLAEKKGLNSTGYELAFYPYTKALLNKFFKQSQVKIERKDFFKQDLQKFDAVFIFLTKEIMNKVGLKLKTNLKPKTIVISYGFSIPDWQETRILETKPSRTFIYLSTPPLV